MAQLKKSRHRIKAILSFDPHKNFLSLPILWCTFFFFVFLALLAAIFIIANTELTWNLSAHGFNSFVKLFKVPLGILALAIPVIALLGSNHRSAQAKTQIELTNQQNIFSNYYKHIEEFIKYIESITIRPTECPNPRNTHKYIFPKASIGNLRVDIVLLENLARDSWDIFKTIDVIKEILEAPSIEGIDNGFYRLAEALINIENRMRYAEKSMDLVNRVERPNFETGGPNDIKFPGYENVKEYLIPIPSRCKAIKKILEFDQSISFPESILNLCNLRLDSIIKLEAGLRIVFKEAYRKKMP